MTFRHPVDDVVLADCLAVNPRGIGDELVGHRRALLAWKGLLHSRSFTSVAVGSSNRTAGHPIIAFGASAFVSERFAECELADPRPGMNGRLIASIDAGTPVVLNQQELRGANTLTGLSLVVLYGTWRRGLLTADEVEQVQRHLVEGFVEYHAGYRFRRWLIESTDTLDIEHAASTGVWRIVSRFEEFYAGQPSNNWNRDRALMVATREDALSVVGSIAGPIFQYRDPVAGFTDSEQSLLLAASRNPTDQQLATELGLKLATVKKRWLSVFERVADALPGLLGSSPKCSEPQGRGSQKRHKVLAYVREHPEELRPLGLSAPSRTKKLR